MLQYKTHEIFHTDIKTLSDEEFASIATLINAGVAVVFKKQNLTVEEEIEVGSRFGTLEVKRDAASQPKYSSLWVKDSNMHIIRVTGEKDEKGTSGLFGHKETLPWHCNDIGAPNRQPLLWIMGRRSVEGSRTSFLNTAMAYHDMSPEEQEELKQIKFKVRQVDWAKYIVSSEERSRITSTDMLELDQWKYAYRKNECGAEGIFFPFMHSTNIEGLAEGDTGEKFCRRLSKYITKNKYVYHHDWEVGDIVLSDQNITQHKRWACDTIEDRLMHRMVTNYDKCTFAPALN